MKFSFWEWIDYYGSDFLFADDNEIRKKMKDKLAKKKAADEAANGAYDAFIDDVYCRNGHESLMYSMVRLMGYVESYRNGLVFPVDEEVVIAPLIGFHRFVVRKSGITLFHGEKFITVLWNPSDALWFYDTTNYRSKEARLLTDKIHPTAAELIRKHIPIRQSTLNDNYSESEDYDVIKRILTNVTEPDEVLWFLSNYKYLCSRAERRVREFAKVKVDHF